MSIDEWKDLKECPEFYMISSDGRLWSKRQNKELACPLNVAGYPHFTITYSDGRQKTTTVHVEMAKTWFGPRPAGLQVRHLNGIPTDNRIENLKYGTALENAQDRIEHGTSGKGQLSSRSALLDNEVLQIRIRVRNGEDHVTVMNDYECSYQQFMSALTGRTYSHVPKALERIYDYDKDLVVQAIKDGYSITEVADSIGISFNMIARVFKKHTGMSVREYRKRYGSVSSGRKYVQ